MKFKVTAHPNLSPFLDLTPTPLLEERGKPTLYEALTPFSSRRRGQGDEVVDQVRGQGYEVVRGMGEVKGKERDCGGHMRH